MKQKIKNWIVLFLFILTCGIMGKYIYNQLSYTPGEQKVQVDYIIYTGPKELHRTKIIKINGDKLAPRYSSYRGTNDVDIVDCNDYGWLGARPRVNIYSGTNYVEVISIKPINE